MELNNKISLARKQANLSQQSLGKAIGVSDKAVSAYEVGRSSPPLKVLQKIADATGKPMSFFLQTSDMPTSDMILSKMEEVEKLLMEIREKLA